MIFKLVLFDNFHSMLIQDLNNLNYYISMKKWPRIKTFFLTLPRNLILIGHKFIFSRLLALSSPDQAILKPWGPFLDVLTQALQGIKMGFIPPPDP